GKTSKRGISPHIRILDGSILGIEGKREVRGSRTPAGHALEGGAEHARDIGGAIEHGVPLGQRFHQRALIELSQREFVSGTYCNVRVDGENRDRRFVRLGEAGKEVGRAAARGTFADADSSGDARVAVGHVGRVPFIPRSEERRVGKECIYLWAGDRGRKDRGSYLDQLVGLISTLGVCE